MVATLEIDMRGLTEFVNNLSRALVGTGQDKGGALGQMIKTEAGQLAWQIGESLGPSKKEGLKGQINADLSKFLWTGPNPKSGRKGLNIRRQSVAFPEIKWLYAGSNFLVGIANDDDRRDASVEDAYRIFRDDQKSGQRLNSQWIPIGKRGRQTIFQVNKTWIKKSVKAGVARFIRDTLVGELRASFVASALQLVPSKLGNMPKFVLDKIEQVRKKGKNIFNMDGLNHPTEPYIEFGSSAPGVQSNPHITSKINAAVEKRKYIMGEKIKQIISGYAYNYKTGGVFMKPKEEQSE